MCRRFVVFITFILWSTTTLPLPKSASAETALNRAIVQSLRNLAQLMPQNRSPHPARVSDAMTPGDALSTGRSSLAELRFNDGSLARVGEQAIFRFVKKTRNFQLSNGTLLLLIPPGRGQTDVWTPNATAAIRGSALFIRYIPETATTVVGALTNSKIEVSNPKASQRQVLQAGQMAVVVKDTIEGLYNFDLKTFYQTSDLVQGLDLNKKSGKASLDPAIASVQAETATALAAQPALTDAGVIVNPTFVSRPENNQTQQPNLNLSQDSQNPFNNNFDSINEFLENSEVISNPDNSPLLPTKAEPSISVPPQSGFPTPSEVNNGGSTNESGVNNGGSFNGIQQPNGGNNSIGEGVGGRVESNPANSSGNAIGGGVGGGVGNNPGSGNGIGGGVSGGVGNNPGSGNAIGGGVGGGVGNNPGSGNGIGGGVGGGVENNPGNNGNNNGVGQGVGGGREDNRGNGNGNNNGVGQGVGGGRENNRGNGNGNNRR